MVADPPRMPGRSNPKLRSSCDGCGAAKLKCDRGQPECGRCVSYGMQCVYGFSRKMGKPPRERLRQNAPPRPSTDLPEQSELPAARYADKLDGSSSNGNANATNNGNSGSSSSSHCDAVMLDMDLGNFPSVAEVPVAWDPMEENSSTNGLMVNLNSTLDGLYGFPPVDLNSIDFTNWDHPDDMVLSNNMQFGAKATSTPESPQLSSYASSTGGSTNQSLAHQNQNDTDADDESSIVDRTLMPPPELNTRGHDCSREAYSILGSLSFCNVIKSHNSSEEGNSSAAENGKQVPSDVPLDHILRLTRDASERLGRLLNIHTCSCPRSPHMALLYASIISRILTWYQQAADCTQNTPWSPAPIVLDVTSQQVSPAASSPSSGSGSSSTTGVGSCTWSNSATSTFSTGSTSTKGTSPLPLSSGLAVAMTKMAIGSFNVDDLHVQTALKVQLLLGEMRRAGCLIELFIASHISDTQSAVPDKTTLGGMDSLYLYLDAWLKSEQEKIANMMRLKLRELNT